VEVKKKERMMNKRKKQQINPALLCYLQNDNIQDIITSKNLVGGTSRQ
jgi:hypothetical protein